MVSVFRRYHNEAKIERGWKLQHAVRLLCASQPQNKITPADLSNVEIFSTVACLCLVIMASVSLGSLHVDSWTAHEAGLY